MDHHDGYLFPYIRSFCVYTGRTSHIAPSCDGRLDADDIYTVGVEYMMYKTNCADNLCIPSYIYVGPQKSHCCLHARQD